MCFRYLFLPFQRCIIYLPTTFACLGILLCINNSFAQSYGGIGGAVSSDAGSSSSAEVDTSDYSSAVGVSGSIVSGGSEASSAVEMSGGESGSISKGLSYSNTSTTVRTAPRQRALVKKFRFEFAERFALEHIIVERATQSLVSANKAGLYLDQFSAEISAGLSGSNDLESLGEDLLLLRETMDVSIEKLIGSYRKNKTDQFALFKKKSLVPKTIVAVQDDLQQLALKNELFVFGKNSLQAMGYFVK
jgi:hypothetical protein